MIDAGKLDGVIARMDEWATTGNELEKAYATRFISLGMCQKGTILPDSVDLAQAQNCQVDLTHALGYREEFMAMRDQKCPQLSDHVLQQPEADGLQDGENS